VVPSGVTYPTTFTAIGAVSAKDAWVAGTTGDSGGLLLERWNGSTWKPFAAPGFGSNVNDSVIGATSATDVWTFPQVGTTGYGLHWNGRKWSVAARNSRWWLYGLTPDGHGGFWLTGEKNQPTGFAPFNSYIVHYSGGHWTYQTAPTRSGYTGPTAGLITRIPGTHSFWALGQLSSASNPFGAADILKYGP
jgi:hypothetical protein